MCPSGWASRGMTAMESVSGSPRGSPQADMVVVCGGVSVGAHDEVRPAFDDVGRVDLWRVAVQPGKPLTFGRASAPDGRQVLLFGLPGNPVSSFVTFELFVRPVLRRLAGQRDLTGRAIIRARLGEAASVDPERRAFLRVVVETDGADGPVARLAGGQGSHMLSGLVAAERPGRRSRGRRARGRRSGGGRDPVR